VNAVEAAPRRDLRVATAWRRLLRLQARVPIVQVVATAAVFAYGAETLPGLSSWPSLKLILCLAALVGLSATGQTLLILLGGFDLSVAAFIVAGALIVTQVAQSYHSSFVVALIAAIALMGSLGAIAGYVCHRWDIQPLIVTLGMGTIALGLAQTQTPGGLTMGASSPGWLVSVSSSSTHTFGLDIPPLVVIWAVVAVLVGVFLHRTVPGRELLATGANMRGAELSLIKTRWFWVTAFAFSGIASCLVGLLVLGFEGAGSTSSGDPYLFQSIIAVIVGGTVFGGPGDYTRTVLGAIFVTVVNVVLVGHGATTADQQIIEGAAILIAVSLYGKQRRARDRV
jgi:ribose transport system permease protein